MDREWFDRTKNLELKEQWETLFSDKMKIRADSDIVWGKSAANAVKNAEVLISEIPGIIKKFNIKSFTDIGCGSFFWMDRVDFSGLGVEYTGYDIVPEMIERNKKRYPDVIFEQLDISKGIPKKADMIFLRSVLIHLTIEQCLNVISNIKKSGSKYLMISTAINCIKNKDTKCLMRVKRNMQLSPFEFGEYEYIIKQRPDLTDGENDEYMGIWKINEI